MTGNFTLCVGTVGSGVWVSPDGGESWRRVMRDLWSESRVFGLTVHPKEPRTIFAGADTGVYRSHDGGLTFDHLDSPMNSLDVWKIAVDPVEPDTIFAGTRPGGLFRSTDGGAHWQKLNVDMAEECANVRVPRVTALTVDPTDHRVVWAGVEVDGVRRSTDSGDTWTRITEGVPDPDIHDVTINVNGKTTVLTTTPHEIFASTDTGKTWHGLGIERHFHLPYCRALTAKADDPNTWFVATGDGAAGSTGAIQRSTDGGKTWRPASLPVEPNSPIWSFATHAADPERIVACSHYGELYASDDGGDSWRKLKREFTEIRAIAWVPN
jgi:photosystem II stability/assembly factor-like uncharacterized protein